MSRNRFILFVLVTAVIVSLSSFRNDEPDTFSQAFQGYFSKHNNQLIEDVLMIYKFVQRDNYKPDSAKKYLSIARKEYKYNEAFIRFFFTYDGRILNSPIIPEMEEDDEVSPYVVWHGFQYLELLLYSDSVQYFQRKLKDEVDEIHTIIGRFNESVSYMNFEDQDIFEAMQLQLVRQFVLGFANFETGESRTGVQESSATLTSFLECLNALYPDRNVPHKQAFDSFISSVDEAVKFLSLVSPMQEPDYFTFYSKHYIPVSGSLSDLRELTVVNNEYYTTAINFNIRSIFDPHSFNTFFFLPAQQLASREEVVKLGQTLFFDPALSSNTLRACASCHQPGMAFTDGLPLSRSFEPGKFLTRNAPTLINSVFQRKLFHDGRAFTFEDQAGQVMSNPLEMHSDFDNVTVKLRTSPEYVEWFRRVFAGTDDTIIITKSILTAIAEYERSLVGMNSRFDKTISGREQALTPDEIQGFNIYMGKANCGSCHFIPLFNGVMPPEYVETEWDIIGVPSAMKAGKQSLDPDIGRSGVVDVEIFKHAFKSPTLRNIDLTAPYMHNGVFSTLEEVIDFYDVGGGLGLGYDVPFQTLAADSLHLTTTEKSQLITFLKALTDTVNITSVPKRLPTFPADESLNNRPIGGNY